MTATNGKIEKENVYSKSHGKCQKRECRTTTTKNLILLGALFPRNVQYALKVIPQEIRWLIARIPIAPTPTMNSKFTKKLQSAQTVLEMLTRNEYLL